MTILFAGSEDIDFITTGAVSMGTTAGWFRAGYVRGVIYTSGSAADPPVNRVASSIFASVSSLWAHGYVYKSSNTGDITNAPVMRFLDASGVCRLVIRVTATNQTWSVWTRNAAGTFTQLGANFVTNLVLAAVTPIDVQINYGTSGLINVYVGGALVFTYSGNVTTDSATTLAQVEWNGVGTTNTLWSEMIVADIDTRYMGLFLLNSGTSGTRVEWTGTSTNVNKAAINDATFITSATAAQVNEYKTGGIALPPGSFTVPAVVTSMRALVGATGPQHVDMGFNFNGTRFWSSDYAPGSAFGNFGPLLWPTNPSTSAPWTTTDIMAATFNYGVQSTT
jgi:hypothetical protein